MNKNGSEHTLSVKKKNKAKMTPLKVEEDVEREAIEKKKDDPFVIVKKESKRSRKS